MIHERLRKNVYICWGVRETTEREENDAETEIGNDIDGERERKSICSNKVIKRNRIQCSMLKHGIKRDVSQSARA